MESTSDAFRELPPDSEPEMQFIAETIGSLAWT